MFEGPSVLSVILSAFLLPILSTSEFCLCLCWAGICFEKALESRVLFLKNFGTVFLLRLVLRERVCFDRLVDGGRNRGSSGLNSASIALRRQAPQATRTADGQRNTPGDLACFIDCLFSCTHTTLAVEETGEAYREVGGGGYTNPQQRGSPVS